MGGSQLRSGGRVLGGRLNMSNDNEIYVCQETCEHDQEWLIVEIDIVRSDAKIREYIHRYGFEVICKAENVKWDNYPLQHIELSDLECRVDGWSV